MTLLSAKIFVCHIGKSIKLTHGKDHQACSNDCPRNSIDGVLEDYYQWDSTCSNMITQDPTRGNAAPIDLL